MRILQINTADRGGGAEGSAWNLFNEYRNRGHESRLAVGKKFSHDPDVFVIPNEQYRKGWPRLCYRISGLVNPWVGKIKGAGRLRNALYWMGQPGRWLHRAGGNEDFSFPGTQQLLTLLPQKPDIIHCHNLHGGYFDLQALPWLSRQAPVILNLRDMWLLTGHCAYSIDCLQWETGCGRCPRLDSYPAVKQDKTDYNWQQKKAIYDQSILYITTPSQWLMDKVHSSMLRGVLYRVIPNAINTPLFSPGSRLKARRNLGVQENAKIVLLIAHSRYKDYATMEAALTGLQYTQSNELLFLCLGKKGPERRIGHGVIRYCGFERDQEKLAQYYRAADVYIHAALDEAFGKTIAEAMACGTPVVATAVGGIPELIDNGVTGFLVPPRNSDAMSAVVSRLLEDADLSSTIGGAAAECARRRFSLDRQADEFLNWYKAVIKDWDTRRFTVKDARINI